MKKIRVVAAVIKADGKIFATQRGYGEYKGGWEFPGGKIESGETPEEALKREIMEELETEIKVCGLIDTVECDYPDFHLSMDCFWCEIVSGNLVLKEHEAARWLDKNSLYSVEWLPADLSLIEKISMASVDNAFLESVANVLNQARKNAKTAVNLSMVYAYYEIGRKIVEEEQQGKNRAAYGKQILKELSSYLTKDFGKGFSPTNLKQMRQFYLTYENDQISQTLSDQFGNFPAVSSGRQFYLSWSHYLVLMRINDINERHFYEIESVKNNWSLSELKRQFNSALYQRLALSTDKDKVYALALEGQKIETPKDAIKDPYVLEFLGLPELPEFSESELESRLIDHLQTFLLELGTGFAFVGRQMRFTFDEEHFIVDLVFYNRLLRCFVLFDLKIGELKHQDIGQMQMYVNYYDRKVKLPDENPTIGVLLCREKNNAVVELTLPENNSQIFASKYETILPSKEALQKLMEEHLADNEIKD